jgi:hypothetical protein
MGLLQPHGRHRRAHGEADLEPGQRRSPRERGSREKCCSRSRESGARQQASAKTKQSGLRLQSAPRAACLYNRRKREAFGGCLGGPYVDETEVRRGLIPHCARPRSRSATLGFQSALAPCFAFPADAQIKSSTCSGLRLPFAHRSWNGPHRCFTFRRVQTAPPEPFGLVHIQPPYRRWAEFTGGCGGVG